MPRWPAGHPALTDGGRTYHVSYRELGRVGRLGNALYEFAATVGTAFRLGGVPQFNADWTHRPYFDVPDGLFADDFGALESCTEVTELVPEIDLRERHYLQHFSLFNDAVTMLTLRRMLQPTVAATEILNEQREAFDALPRPILSVHVRRGDNVQINDPDTPNKHLYHPMPTQNYYRNATDHALFHAETPPASVAVFSDDPDWCEEHLPGHDYYHRGVVRPKEHEPDFLTAPVLDWIDWQLIRACDLHVCSNSTFSLMAAIMSGNPTVVPHPFFGPKLDYIDPGNMYPSDWVRLHNETGEP